MSFSYASVCVCVSVHESQYLPGVVATPLVGVFSFLAHVKGQIHWFEEVLNIVQCHVTSTYLFSLSHIWGVENIKI